MEDVLQAVRKKLTACARPNAPAHLRNAAAQIDVGLVWLKTPQGMDAEGRAFWGLVNDHLKHTADAMEGDEEAIRWLAEHCPVDFSAVGADSTKTFADQAKARLMKLKEPQKVSG